MKIAALDLGSNTFLCLIAEVEKNQQGQLQITKIYSDEVQVVRLGQELEKNRKFHPDALRRADECLKKFSQTIEQHQPEKVLAMATSASRDAENKDELFKLGLKHNIPIEIIPGDREASITYQGAISGLENTQQNFLIVDIGGGSTEFIFGRGSEILAGESYNIGCVRMTEKFITSQPTSDSECFQVTEFIQDYLLKAKALMPKDFKLHHILAVAGTPTTLAAVEIGRFEASAIDGYVFTDEKLNQWLQKLKSASLEEKLKMGIPAGRADVILIGVITLLQTLKTFGFQQMKVSTRGVRYGVALELAHRHFFNK